MLKIQSKRFFSLLLVGVIGLSWLFFVQAGPFTVTPSCKNETEKLSVKKLRERCGELSVSIIDESQRIIRDLADLNKQLFEMLCDHIDGSKDSVLAINNKEPLEKLKTGLQKLSKTLESEQLQQEIKAVVAAYNECLECVS